MDKPSIQLSRSISPTALDSFSLTPGNQEEITDSSLFPYLDQMSDLQVQGMESPVHETPLGSNDEEMSKPDLTARTLLDAAERVLRAEGGKLHVKDLEEKMVEYRLIPQSAKSLANLESVLYRETFGDNSKFKRIEGRMGWFALVGVDVDDMESDGSSSEEDQSESMDNHSINTPPRPKAVKTTHHHDYKNKYYSLRKMVKELIFLNAATSDDIARTEAKLTRAKAERKFLLKRLFQYQAATEAGVLHPHGISTLSQDGPPPIVFPDVPLERHKTQTKMKVKKTLSKGKDEKGNERLKGLGQHMKSKNSLHIKLTQAKQARNLAKLAGQHKVSGNSRSTAQSKSPSQNKTAVAEKTQTQTKTLTQAKQVVQAKTPQAPKTAIQLTEVPPIPGAKDKRSDKPKTSRPKAKKPKTSESPQTSAVTPSPTQGNESCDDGWDLSKSDSVKPKRKKPGTAIKRKVQPIPVDGKGKPIFPIVLGGLTVHSLGEIVCDRPGFHSERYIWPVGYCSSRTYPSITDPEKKCLYTCKILDGGFGPQFEMCPEDDAEHPINASSATACHCVVLKTLNKARGRDASNTGSGPEFFGYSHPTIQYLIQNLPGAKKCTKYQWVKFDLPKPQTKQGGKLTSACNLSFENQLSPQKETTHLSSSSSSQEGIGLGDDSTMDQDDNNLTLHSSAMTDTEDNIFEDIDIPTSLRPLTLASSNATLSSQRLPSPLSPTSQLSGIGTDNDIDTDMGPLMSSPTSNTFSTSLPITLSPPSLTSPSSTSAGNGSFIIPLTSPLFGSSSGFSSSVLPDLPK